MEIAKETGSQTKESLGYQVRAMAATTPPRGDTVWCTKPAHPGFVVTEGVGCGARHHLPPWLCGKSSLEAAGNICLDHMAKAGFPCPLKSRCRPKARTDRRMSSCLPAPANFNTDWGGVFAYSQKGHAPQQDPGIYPGRTGQ